MLFSKELKRMVINPVFILLLCFIALTRWLVVYAAENGLSVFDLNYDKWADTYIDKTSSLPIEKAYDVLEKEYEKFSKYQDENKSMQEAFIIAEL